VGRFPEGKRRAATTLVPDTTSDPFVTSTTAVAPASVGTGPFHVLPFSGPALPFGKPTHLAVYLTPSGPPRTMLVYEIDTGRVLDIDLGQDAGWYTRAFDGAGGSVLLDGGVVLRATAEGITQVDQSPAGVGNSFTDAPDGRLAPGPDGRIWLRTLTPPSLVLLDETGTPSTTHYDLPIGADLYGSMADGRPVVRGADKRSIIVERDGRHTPLATGLTTVVEHGQFIETVCDAALRCSHVAHLGAKKRALGDVAVGTPGFRSYRLQPDGPLVATDDGGLLSLLDTDTSVFHPSLLSGVIPSAFGDESLLSSSVMFLPGGVGLAALTNDGLVLLDLSGRVVATIALGPGGGPGPPILGIGRADGLP